jgi:hypothetical protein
MVFGMALRPRSFISCACSLVLTLLCASTASADTGQIVVVTTPPGAEVAIDGVHVGRAPLARPDLLPGEHLVDVAWPGGVTRQAVVHVTGGASQVVQLRAEEPAPPPQPEQKPEPKEHGIRRR